VNELGGISDEEIARFADRLKAFSDELSPRDQALLEGLLVRAMDPLERRRQLGAGGTLSVAEDELLRQLESNA
jgi:hypothetical protein